MSTLAVVAGTRPECLKLVSLLRSLSELPDLNVLLINSGQHPGMVRRTLGQWSLQADLDLPALPPGLSLSTSVRQLRAQIGQALIDCGAQALVVQGDTSTAYAGALAATAAGRVLLHVEAGLRTADPRRPFPEEMFRRGIGGLAHWHYAPTTGAAAHLRSEGVADERIMVTGNTGIDALRLALVEQNSGPEAEASQSPLAQRCVVLTLHRRENYGVGLDQVCTAVLVLLARHADLWVLCPVHPNPQVGGRMRQALGGHPRIRLADPMDYVPFVQALAGAALVMTDSGGIQEEAPYLGVPVLVARDCTERPEALGAAVRLVATRCADLVEAAETLLAAPRPAALPFDEHAAFGDGLAGARISQHIQQLLGVRPPGGRVSGRLSAPSTSSETVQAAALRLRAHLLDGPAQLRSGPEAGGVAGGLDADGRPQYVYGEITGYYLQWLASSHLPADPRRAAAAQRALDWCLRRYGAGGAVPTRIALLGDSNADWRNTTEFCFDLAMLVGGLSAAAAAGLIEAPRHLLRTLLQRLLPFAAAGQLRAVPASSKGLPVRWSTRSGPFLLKAAARIRSASAWVDLPAALQQATEVPDAAALDGLQVSTDPLHPTLYALEGALALGVERGAVHAVLRQLLQNLDVRGTLPESAAQPQVRRSDIMAQALRVCCCLGQESGVPEDLQASSQAMCAALLARVRADGSICFDGDPAAAQRQPRPVNIWCAMFAEQALSWSVQLPPAGGWSAAEIV